MSLGERILKLMKEKDVTRSELSDSLNINYQTLCKYLQDKRYPTDEILIDIANYFNVSLDYLIGRNPSIISDEEGNVYFGEMSSIEELHKIIDELDKDDLNIIYTMAKRFIELKNK